MSANTVSFSAFTRPIDGIRSKSTSGGIITILAYTSAILLFLSQLFLYMQVDVRHSLDLAPSFPLSEVVPTEGGFSYKILQSRQRTKANAVNVAKTLNWLDRNKIDVYVHVTFPYIKCDDLDFAHNGHFFSTGDFSKYHGYAKFSKRHPTEYDLGVALNGGLKGLKNVKSLSKKKRSNDARAVNACSVRGTISVPKISGDLSIHLSKDAFLHLVSYMNMGFTMDQIDARTGGHELSHYIHEIKFGPIFPLTTNPLSNKMVTFDNQWKLGLNHMSVKLVPTRYKRFARAAKETFQISTSNHIVTMETLANAASSGAGVFVLPGIKMQYDFTPLEVRHVESRENFFVFLSSLIGIVGGVFVTVGLVSGIVVKSAQVVKKLD